MTRHWWWDREKHGLADGVEHREQGWGGGLKRCRAEFNDDYLGAAPEHGFLPLVGEVVLLWDHEGNTCLGTVLEVGAGRTYILARRHYDTWRDGVLVGLPAEYSMRNTTRGLP